MSVVRLCLVSQVPSRKHCLVKYDHTSDVHARKRWLGQSTITQAMYEHARLVNRASDVRTRMRFWLVWSVKVRSRKQCTNTQGCTNAQAFWRSIAQAMYECTSISAGRVKYDRASDTNAQNRVSVGQNVIAQAIMIVQAMIPRASVRSGIPRASVRSGYTTGKRSVGRNMIARGQNMIAQAIYHAQAFVRSG